MPFRSGDGRGKYKVADIASKYNLGNPVAGNYYQVDPFSVVL